MLTRLRVNLIRNYHSFVAVVAAIPSKALYIKGLATMQPWTIQQIAVRFEQAAQVARCLPTPRAKGFTGCWELILQQKSLPEGSEYSNHYHPPSPEAVELMLESCRWVVGLATKQRKLIWLRAKGYSWRHIAERVGCHRVTAKQRWLQSLNCVVQQLNKIHTTLLP